MAEDQIYASRHAETKYGKTGILDDSKVANLPSKLGKSGLAVLAVFGFISGALGVVGFQAFKEGASRRSAEAVTISSGPTPSPPVLQDDSQLSPQSIYDKVAPAVVTLKVYNGIHQPTYSGSGFIIADQPKLPVRIDTDAKRFAADLFDCDDAADLNEQVVAPRAPNQRLPPTSDGQHGFLTARRQATERVLPSLQQVYIATNYHVIDSGVSIHVRMLDGSTGFVSQVIYEDDAADIAVLLAWLPSGRAPGGITLSDVGPNIGARVLVIGSPRGLESSLSDGLISGIREFEPGHSVLQISAAISHGSSGGPVLTTNGKVVGIATASRPGGQNLNFAVPASEVLRLLAMPPKSREVWRGRSIVQESQYAIDCAKAALKGKEGGTVTARTLTDASLAALLSFGGSKSLLVHFASVEEAEFATTTAILQAPTEFQYLAYFYAGEFQLNEARTTLVRGRNESSAAFAQRARSDFHVNAAFGAYLKVVELNPDFAPVYKGLASVLGLMDILPEQRRYLDRLKVLVPHSAEVYGYSAICYSHLGQHHAAVREYQTALDLDPKCEPYQEFLANEYMTLTDYDKAIEAYQRAIALAPPNYPGCDLCRYNIGIAHKFSGRYEEAIKAFRRCMQAPSCPSYSTEDCIRQIAACEAALRNLGRPVPP